MRIIIVFLALSCMLTFSCKDTGIDISGGDGKKRLSDNIWIARTSASEYVLVDALGEGLLYGDILACKKIPDNRFCFRYKDFNSGKTVSVVLDKNGSKVGAIMDSDDMIEIGKFYESILISK